VGSRGAATRQWVGRGSRLLHVVGALECVEPRYCAAIAMVTRIAMFLPRHFAENDLTVLDALAESHPFATLVTQTEDGPFASHLPVLYRRDGGAVLIEGHWSRANPQWRYTGTALLILHGPHAYISPTWYPDKEQAARVPTWNYAVAHLSGPLETFEDTAALADLVDRMSRVFEATVGGHWLFEADQPELANQLHGIVGFRLCPTRIEIKFKLNQNHPPANVGAVAEALATAGGENERAVAALMRARLDASNKGEPI
jgi:transcriptional regulator